MSDQGQLALPLGPDRDTRLFSAHFLGDVLPGWPELADVPLGAVLALADLWEGERAGLPGANEAQTEERWIKPVLSALGYAFTVQAGLPTGSGRRQPDYALFLDDDARAEADGHAGAARYARAVAVADAKRFDRPLDRRRVAGALSEDPVAQIVHYITLTRRPWGILTNGRLWRLYGAAGDLVEGAFFEVDLIEALERHDERTLRYFARFFGADAHRQEADGTTFLERALAENRANAVAVGDQLERQVFAAVPLLAEGLLADEERTEGALERSFEHALIILFRLLFCLYAEARGLLPVENPHYRRYSVREQRVSLARDREAGRVFSTRSDDLYNDLRALFRIVDRGDPALGVNEYDGGLFAAGSHPWLRGRSVPDSLLAPALDGLYRVGGALVDYRDLSVRHLGTIYERLLDFRLTEGSGLLTLEHSSGRRDTGSYFTPQDVVDAIVERTLEPLLTRRSAAARELDLRGDEALAVFLGLRVVDPAMGSGHFLVTAAAYIAQYIATDPSYDGDLPLAEIQRLVAERCLYGVDLNPMAVELARLSLWLTTVRGHEPLTFLPNLRVGNSLVGAEVSALAREGDDLFAADLGRDAERLLAGVGSISARASQTGEDVHAKAAEAETLVGLRAPLAAYADAQMRPSYQGSTHRFHWDLEFPEVFLDPEGQRLSSAGFDAVVGNPPYVRIQKLGRALAEYCRARFATATGSFDAYVPFLERSLELLAPAGRLGFIVPSRLLKADYGARLRGMLAAGRLVEEIVDFGDAQVFAGATNYTCILLLDRAGSDGLSYRRLSGDGVAVRRALVDLDTVPAERFPAAEGSAPWVLTSGTERRVLAAAGDGAEPLGSVVEQIFQGLITSADDIYILEDRGARGDRRLVHSKASDEELELEPDLLHPLATGSDVDRYAFEPLRRLLLFPYEEGVDGPTRLIAAARLAELPRTAAYLAEHEAELRARERGKMDRADWYGYVYPKSLGAHVLPKLGVAATVRHLEIAADPGGEVYFHNVRVNGILPREGAASLWTLLVLLNSRLLDYVFRRIAVPHAGGHFAANKQWIAPLPIRTPPTGERAAFDALGRRLHELARTEKHERAGFLDWLGGFAGAPVERLAGGADLRVRDARDVEHILAVLRSNRPRISVDPDSRAARERIRDEHDVSAGRLTDLRSERRRAERRAEEMVFGLYAFPDALRRAVDGEYG